MNTDTYQENMQNYIKLLRNAGAKVGKNVFIGHQVFIELENAPLLKIEDNVVISAFCKLILHDSSLNNVIEEPIRYGRVHLKSNCYIGADCLILPDSVVGKNTIVGAGSLVKGELKPNSVYFGRPAKYSCSVSELKRKWEKDSPENKNIIQIKTQKWHKRNKDMEKLLEKEKENKFRRSKTFQK